MLFVNSGKKKKKKKLGKTDEITEREVVSATDSPTQMTLKLETPARNSKKWKSLLSKARNRYYFDIM